MQTQRRHGLRLPSLLIGFVLLVLAGAAAADPPLRVARLGYMSGPVSFSPAGENEWVEASLNRPIVTGDRLWADHDARVELQVGTAAVRLGPTTSVTLLNLDDRVLQVQLAQGMLSVRVRHLDRDQVVEIDTPNLAFVIRQPGQYRIAVDPNGNATEVLTRRGQAEVFGDGAAYVVDAGRAYRFFGTALADYDELAAPPPDAFDRWAQERDRGYDTSPSARYVSPEVVGYQDLDAYGAWRVVPEYGNVWMPTRVVAGWAPYRDGHWAWVEPWGWTWIDDAPWGFAVSHYGRWAFIRGGWGWIPGPVAARAVYAPALVAFVGGGGFQVALTSGRVGAVGWFPLGPRDVYRPAYNVSRTYFTNVNVTNTVINTTNITNVYNNRGTTNVRYMNQQVPGAVIAVPTAAFVASQPVARTALRVPQAELVRAPVNAVAVIAPTPVSVRGAGPQAKEPPVQERRIVARTEPPAAPVGFAAKERALANNPGKPIEATALPALRTASPTPAARVELVRTPNNAQPAAAPPPQPAAGQQREAGSRREPGGQPQPAATIPAPSATTPVVRGQQAPTAPAQPVPEPRNRQEQRATPTAPPVIAAPPVVAPPAVPPVSAPPAAARPPQAVVPVQPAPEPRNRPEQRVAPAAPAPAPAAPAARPPQFAPPPTQAQPPAEQQRGRPAPQAQPAPAPAARPPESRPANAAPPPKAEPKPNEPRAPVGKKPDDAGKGDEELKRKP